MTRLQEIQDRLVRARDTGELEQPWTVVPPEGYDHLGGFSETYGVAGPDSSEEIAELIAHAPDDMQHLLDELVHLLLDYPPKISLTTLVIAIKTNTSRVVREQDWPEITTKLWGEHFWSPSYCAVSTGGAALDVVKQYVETQRQPARKPGRPKRAHVLTPDLTDGVRTQDL